MEIFDGHRALFRPLARPAIALGNFDGIHLGHQKLLGKVVAAARALAGDAVVMTFEPHPAAFFAPERAPRLITNPQRKLELLSEHHIDVCIREPFDRAFAALSPDEFVQDILVDVLGAKHVVVGYDFTYGRERSGNTRTLCEAGEALGFVTEVVEPITHESSIASSTEIRNRMMTGDVRGAAALLGRPMDLDGTVVHGAGRGRTIGVPTANIETDAELLPAPGVYAVTVRVLDDLTSNVALPGVANLGTNPTVSDTGKLSLEVHLLDRDDELYGKRLRTAFVDRLRAEQRFPGVDELVAQIRLDIERARTVLRQPAPSL